MIAPQAHRVTNAAEIPFTGAMQGKYPVTFSQAQELAAEKGRDVYWLVGNATAYYEPQKAAV